MGFELVYIEDVSTYFEDRDLDRLYKKLQGSYLNLGYMTPKFIKDNIRVVLCPICYTSDNVYAKTSDVVMKDRFQCLRCIYELEESGYYLGYHDVIIQKIYPRWRWRHGAI